MPELTRPDATLWYEVSGEGPPLMLIAGLMSDSASWGPLLPLLEPHFTIIRPDNRTTGRTLPWDAPCSPRIWAEDALALMEHLDLPKVAVVGHSLGGMIGWQIAHMAPDRLDSLLMMGSAPKSWPRNLDVFRGLIATRRSDAPPETWLRLLFPWLFSDSHWNEPGKIDEWIALSLAYPHAQSADAMEHQLRGLEGVDPTPFRQPPSVRMRALLAGDDLLVPRAPALVSLDGIPTKVIDGVAHSLHWDAPDLIAQEVLSFFKKETT